MSAIQRKFDKAREGQKAKAPKAKHADTPWETYGAVGIWSPTGKECVAEASEPKPKETYVHHESAEAWSPGFRIACANARHICLCVNTHERLVEALKNTLALVESVADQQAMPDDSWLSITRKYRALLSEIEKGGAE